MASAPAPIPAPKAIPQPATPATSKPAPKPTAPGNAKTGSTLLQAPQAKQQAPQVKPAPAAASAPLTPQAASTPQMAQPLQASAASPRNPQPEPPLERGYLPAGPPRPRRALREKNKAPSIGGLIHSMQAKPSNTPYVIAAVTSAIWLVIGGLLGFVLVGQSVTEASGWSGALGTSSVYIIAAAILVPIALFWFIAQLVWRSQEMKLMASAMTEVAIRLAEPDKMAEQKVASVGQTIRRQVSAMDDAISRALGRAGELESLVHNEVAALERSYSQNEHIIRNLVSELVSQRDAISKSGADVSKSIRSATDSVGEQVTKALKTSADQTLQIKKKVSEELPQLLTRMDTQQQKLGKVIDGANKNLGSLDTTLAKRTGEIDEVIARHTGELNKRLAQKVKALDASLAMRTKAMDKTLADKAKEIDTSFLTHRDAIDDSLQKKAGELDQSIARQAEAMDASLTEKARTIDSALNERLVAINEGTASAPPVATSNVASGLRGSQALERAMSHQSDNMKRSLDSNSSSLHATIGQQNELSPEIAALTKKHDQLLHDHAGQIAHVREKYALQLSELTATARLLEGPDMKMNAMMGPQQNQARAILNDIGQRMLEVEASRLASNGILDNSMALSNETALTLQQALAANASPRAQAARKEVEHKQNDTFHLTEQSKQDMVREQEELARQVTMTVGGMSRSTSRTKILPGDLAGQSSDVQKAVAEQLQALDALNQISGAAVSAGQAAATSQAGGAQGTTTTSHASRQRAALAKAGGSGKQRPSQWSFGDLLARVAENEAGPHDQPLPSYAQARASASTNADHNELSLDPLDVLRMDDIARALDAHTAALAWQRANNGERDVFSRRLYTPEGQKTHDQILERYNQDNGFRATVEKYVRDFEVLLNEAEQKDPSGRVLQNYITSESGRAYLMLAHISGRLG